jgi:hypothetical protein
MQMQWNHSTLSRPKLNWVMSNNSSFLSLSHISQINQPFHLRASIAIEAKKNRVGITKATKDNNTKKKTASTTQPQRRHFNCCITLHSIHWT